MALPPNKAYGQLCETLRNQIEEGGIPFKKTIDGEIIRSAEALPKFYEMNAYQPVWVEQKGRLERVDEMIRALQDAEKEGLNPDDYHLAKIQEILKKGFEVTSEEDCSNYNRLLALEMLLSDAFLLYGSHLLDGRVNPKAVDSEWYAEQSRSDMAPILFNAIQSNEIQKTLQDLAPGQPAYGKLKEALKRYRQIAAKGGWNAVPYVKKLQKDDSDPRVALIAQRLAAELGDVDAVSEEPGPASIIFDDKLETSVRKFQRLRGLNDDGVVGQNTLAAMNRSTQACVKSIEINMERWRWLPRDLGERYILVNTANFSADVMEKDYPVMTLRVIVGMQYRETPVFSHRISYLVLNPYWHVPKKLAVEDKLPMLQKNPYLLMKQKIRIFRNTGIEEQEIDPRVIDWSKVTKYNFRYRLRQDPGPLNALGRVKFMFPNRFNVYLHDTPARELFDKTVRTFSSGCIRIEKALDLAAYLLKDDPNWTPESILTELDKNKEKTVKLKNPMPIHLQYWTALVDESGDVNFRNDIYERDMNLIRAFYQEPPQTVAFLKQ
ncbi:MAG: L,D-transpeptidase family protein [Proteobacteria bacterium]|nr:L,D-transpeptidase family protein [Pseudomonadota bacterium]MBU4469064.1 L,D-transpeptidase family protein [Pseudomonadota bacterium]MCG2751036.1 L,D-transpeptidase family protein [Desulfobacteraceae bacterium]